MHQASGHVATVGAIDLLQGVVTLVQFKQAPLGGRTVQVGHALSDERGRSLGDKQMETLDQELARGGQAAGIKPEDRESESGIDGGLSFRCVDSEHREGRLAFSQNSPGIDRAKRLLQVNAGGQAGDGEVPMLSSRRKTRSAHVA